MCVVRFYCVYFIILRTFCFPPFGCYSISVVFFLHMLWYSCDSFSLPVLVLAAVRRVLYWRKEGAFLAGCAGLGKGAMSIDQVFAMPSTTFWHSSDVYLLYIDLSCYASLCMSVNTFYERCLYRD